MYSLHIPNTQLSEKMPDFIGLVWYWTGRPGIVSFFHSSTALIRCRTAGIPAFILTHTLTVTHTHAHAPTWESGMDMEIDKHHGCRNADIMFSPASLVFR